MKELVLAALFKDLNLQKEIALKLEIDYRDNSECMVALRIIRGHHFNNTEPMSYDDFKAHILSDDPISFDFPYFQTNDTRILFLNEIDRIIKNVYDFDLDLYIDEYYQNKN